MATAYPALTGDFIADRAAWKAAGCPADHPYLLAPAEFWAGPAEPIEPLFPGITPEMVTHAAAMKAAGMLPERPIWR